MPQSLQVDVRQAEQGETQVQQETRGQLPSVTSYVGFPVQDTFRRFTYTT